MASVVMKWREPEAGLPWSVLDVSNRKRVMGWERPLHAMAKAAAFLPLEIFEKGLEGLVWNSVWQLLIAGGLCFSCWLSRLHQKKNFGTSKNSAPQERGGGGGGAPTHPRGPTHRPTPYRWGGNFWEGRISQGSFCHPEKWRNFCSM